MRSLSDLGRQRSASLIAELIPKLDNVQQEDERIRSDCPLHEAIGERSLFMQPDGHGGVTFRCSDGCDPEKIREFYERCEVIDGDRPSSEVQIAHEGASSHRPPAATAFVASATESAESELGLQRGLDSPAEIGDDAERDEVRSGGGQPLEQAANDSEMGRTTITLAPHPILHPTTPRIAKIALADIRLSPEIEPRETIDGITIEQYREAYKDAEPLPPVDVFFDENLANYWLVDGRHRLEAQRLLGVDEISATVHIGKKSDAMLFAAKANVTHGRRRSSGDAVKAAKIATRALHQKHPARRPTIAGVMAAAYVSKETALKAINELEFEGNDLGPKDARGGKRQQFGREQTKPALASAEDEATLNPEEAPQQYAVLDPETGEPIDKTIADCDQNEVEVGEAVAPRSSSADAIASVDTGEAEIVQPVDRIRLQAALDRAAELLAIDPPNVAEAIDVEFKAARVNPVIAGLALWSALVDAAIASHDRALDAALR